MAEPHRESLSVVGLFAGIGGIEFGLQHAGHRTQLLCEIDPGASEVLRHHFNAEIKPNICELGPLPKVDLVTAGFPCQDLSQAGRTAGIGGVQSSLISEVFKRLGDKRTSPRWLLLENVPFILQLQRGRAMRFLVDELESLGFTWAYRVIDTRAFGLPQRRLRVLLLASRTEDPRPVLFANNAREDVPSFSGDQLCGFYWTEGSRGLGWAVDAIPTLKGGSSIGIPSPPAIWNPREHSFVTPDIRDTERLQGFDADWTAGAVRVAGVRRGHRWKLVGNAVSVPVARWIGEQLTSSGISISKSLPLKRGVAWPKAAWGHGGQVYTAEVSSWPVCQPAPSLSDFLQFPCTPLSYRASAGFLSRAEVSGLFFQDGFLADMRAYVKRMSRVKAA